MARSGTIGRRGRAVLGLAVLAGAILTLNARCRSVRVEPAARLAAYDDGAYARLLASCVHDGLVDYAALRSRHADDLAGGLDRFLDPDDPRRDAALAAARAGRVTYPPYDWSINAAGAP